MDYKEKAKAYDKARKVIKDNLNALNEITETGAEIVNIQSIKNCFYRAFPELKERVDSERIRKGLIKLVKKAGEGYENVIDGVSIENAIAWLEKQGEETSWKPSKEEMDVLYGLAYITNQYDEHKEEIITRLYQDLKREFFNGSSYENMFPNTEDDVRRRSTIQVLEYARSLDNYNQYGKAYIDKNIAWLEKQGESYTQRDVDNAYIEGMAFAKDELEKQGEKKPTNKIEPKFKVGDTIKYFGERQELSEDKHTIKEIKNDMYVTTLDTLIPLKYEGNYELVEQKTTDNVKPKFKVGDFIVNDYCFGKVIEITNDAYLLNTGQGIPFSCEHNTHLWTIQDAKDGDVLQLGEVTAIFKEYIGNGNCRCYCSICNEEFEISVEDGEDNVYGCTNTKPATKKQRNLLFQKMKEEGYVWDAEKKELSPVKLKAGQVLKQDNLSILCLGGRNAVKCNGEHFVIQYPDEWIEVYGEEYDKFFTRLQSSGYYYDFLHNQVKENCNTLWVARDFDGALAVFTNKPVLTKSKNRWIDLTDKNDFFNVLPEYYYPKVTFENSPLQLFHL